MPFWISYRNPELMFAPQLVERAGVILVSDGQQVPFGEVILTRSYRGTNHSPIPMNMGYQYTYLYLLNFLKKLTHHLNLYFHE